MGHILMVDDDAIVAEHASQILIDAGHACGWVGDAETAMRVIRKRRPDLLLLDENLPGESGTGLLRRLRGSAEFYDLPVIMVTAQTGGKDEQIALYNGAQDYIRKPFSDRLLLFRVEQALDARRAHPRHRSLAENLGIVPTAQGNTRRFC